MKTHLPNRHFHRAGLTLVELLVCLGIIVLLVCLLFPTCGIGAQKRGRLTDSLSNAKQIGLALRMYAEDHDGKFPARSDCKPFVPGDFSNQALEQLMPKYCTSKKTFRNKNSAWCKEPSEDAGMIDTNRVKRGQNDWIYVTGLTDKSDKDWPVIATGTQSATDLTYTNLTTKRGGVWGGRDAVIGYVDGSVRLISGKEMDCTDKTKTFPKRPDTGANMFIGTADWLGTGRLVLVPE